MCNIKSDGRLMSDGVLCFTEIQLQHEHLPNSIEQYLKFLGFSSITMTTR